MKKTVSRPHDNWGKLQRATLKYLKGNDLRVYADLLTYANDEGKCWPSVATIAKDLGMHSRNVQKSLANLEQDGWIEKHFRFDTSTVYQLYYVEVKDKTKTKKSLKKKMKPSDGVVKSTRSGVVKRTAPQVADLTVSGVADSTTLTDHLTDHNNRHNEQLVPVVKNENVMKKNDYSLTVDERIMFDKLFDTYRQEGESKSSALSAFRKYASLGDPSLMTWIETSLDSSTGTYMTTQMKHIREDYDDSIERKRREKEFQEEQLKLPPERRM